MILLENVSNLKKKRSQENIRRSWLLLYFSPLTRWRSSQRAWENRLSFLIKNPSENNILLEMMKYHFQELQRKRGKSFINGIWLLPYKDCFFKCVEKTHIFFWKLWFLRAVALKKRCWYSVSLLKVYHYNGQCQTKCMWNKSRQKIPQ